MREFWGLAVLGRWEVPEPVLPQPRPHWCQETPAHPALPLASHGLRPRLRDFPEDAGGSTGSRLWKALGWCVGSRSPCQP